MKKFLIFGVIMLFVVSLFGVAYAGDKPLKVILLINGTLGDKSFFDSAARGIKKAEKVLGIEAKIVELGYDPSTFKPGLEDAADSDYDIVICGTWQMQEALQEIAPEYPDKKFIIFDTSVDYKKGDLSNVYSILYKQNEGSFLAGALAAMVTTSKELPDTNDKKLIGFLGGMDIPVINDFLVGYIEGARYIDKDIKILISYAGSFSDPAKGKELVLAQYRQGADISFNVAGETGLGLLDAAKEAKKYAIGVDSDQAMLFAESDPEKAKRTLTSMLKRVDNSLFRALKLHLEGKLPYGKAEALGLAEEAVGLAKNEIYRKYVPKTIQAQIGVLEEKIISGKIKVDTAFGMSQSELTKLRNSVKP